MLVSPLLQQPSHGMSVILTVAEIERFILQSGKTGRVKYETRVTRLEDEKQFGERHERRVTVTQLL